MLSSSFAAGDEDIEGYLFRRKQRMFDEMTLDGLTHDYDDSSDINNIFAPLHPIPSLTDCFINDRFLDEQHIMQWRLLLTMRALVDDQQIEGDTVICKQRRKQGKKVLARETEDGELIPVMPTQSLWYILYVSSPNVRCKGFQHKLCWWFWMPYSSFLAFVANPRLECGSRHGLDIIGVVFIHLHQLNFEFWDHCIAWNEGGHLTIVKKPPGHYWCSINTPSPIELLILGSLYYLGWGWAFDNCEEVIAIGEETHHCFFHKFIFGNYFVAR